MNIPTIQELAYSINLPTNDWNRRCGEVIANVLKDGILDGQLKWGYYIGFIHQNSIFCENALIKEIDHFWLELDDGRVLDPSKWIITCELPYIYIRNDNDYSNGIDYPYETVLD